MVVIDNACHNILFLVGDAEYICSADNIPCRGRGSEQIDILADLVKDDGHPQQKFISFIEAVVPVKGSDDYIAVKFHRLGMSRFIVIRFCNRSGEFKILRSHI